MDVSRKLFCIFIDINKDRFVTALKKMTSSLALYVKVGGVSTVYMSHDLWEIACRCFHQQVVMVTHQAKCMCLNIPNFQDFI